MTPIRIEVHNEQNNGTFVLTVGGEGWQEQAREFIKARATDIRSFNPSLKVWAVLFRGAEMRRIEA
jgi:hypothetical protein